MPAAVPESLRPSRQEEPAGAAAEIVDVLLEVTGAAAGCVGWLGPDGRLTFPVTRGRFPGAWLDGQQGRGGLWGFEVRGGPTLLNDLPPLPGLGEPRLRNLLSCPLASDGATSGHVLLANKPHGFTSRDATVLGGFASLLTRQLREPASRGLGAEAPPGVLKAALERSGDGFVIADEDSRVVFVNAAWLEATGFAAEEVLGRRPPYPFWVSHGELADLAARPPDGPRRPGLSPFRRRDGTVFWCQVVTEEHEVAGRRHVVARTSLPATGASAESAGWDLTAARPRGPHRPGADWLALLLRPGSPAEFWEPRWEALTGLKEADVRGVPTEVLLDWLFPSQRDRDLVADLLHQPHHRAGTQKLLDIQGRPGARPLLCTFLPVSEGGRNAWLLLAARPEGAAGADNVRADTPEPARAPHGAPGH